MNDYTDIPQSWPRVRAALTDRIERKAAVHVTKEWEASRFNPSEALRYIVEHGCIRPVDVEHVR